MPYLRADKLQPGDLLLVKSRGKGSDAIELASGGPYSHAAIYAGHFRLFEALTTGVGYTELPVVKVEVHDDGWWRVFCDVSAYERIDIFRTPEFARPPDFGSLGFQTRLADILWDYNGLDYSLFRRLAMAVEVGRRSPKLSSGVMGLIGSLLFRDASKELPGPFCSELAVEALTEAGFTVRVAGREACWFSPSDLADPTLTCLEPVLECLEEVDPNKACDEEKIAMITKLPWPDSKRIGNAKKQSRRIQSFVERLARGQGVHCGKDTR